MWVFAMRLSAPPSTLSALARAGPEWLELSLCLQASGYDSMSVNRSYSLLAAEASLSTERSRDVNQPNIICSPHA